MCGVGAHSRESEVGREKVENAHTAWDGHLMGQEAQGVSFL